MDKFWWDEHSDLICQLRGDVPGVIELRQDMWFKRYDTPSNYIEATKEMMILLHQALQDEA